MRAAASNKRMRVETITRKGKEFAVIPVKALQRLMEDAEMLADVKAYDAAKARLEDGEDELIPLEITERRLRGEPALRIWRGHRKLTQEQLAKKAKVSRALIAAIETKRKAGSVSTWKKLGTALDLGVGGAGVVSRCCGLEKTQTRNVRGIPPFAKCAKDGAPLVLLMPTRSKDWATRHCQPKDESGASLRDCY